MADEREEHYDGQEEEEYHFSDDQVQYEMETDVPKAPASEKVPFLTKLNEHRRTLIGGVVFIILIGVVYKIIMPTAVAPLTEFSQGSNTNNLSVKISAKPPAETIPSSNQTAALAEEPATPVTSLPEQSPAAPSVSAVTSPPDVSAMPSSSPAQPVASETPPPAVNPSFAAGSMDPGQAKIIMDKIASLEQQNSAVMNLLQTEYAQKIADNETQTTAVRGKIDELNKRVSNIEVGLNQITQLLQGALNKPLGVVIPGMPPPKPPEPKMIYTVQAIIPGRAWLKSESGDTVTVAEGDILKEYGRITKIDPYDGIVDIDTGSKIITLSYGVGGG